MDNILNDKNYELYMDISVKVFGDNSYFNCIKTYTIIKTFSDILPEYIINDKVDINYNLLITKKQIMKNYQECLNDIQKNNKDLYKMEIILRDNRGKNSCIKNTKFVRRLNDRLNELIIQDKNYKKKYHEIAFTQ